MGFCTVDRAIRIVVIFELPCAKRVRVTLLVRGVAKFFRGHGYVLREADGEDR